jgi:hypothetical protein
MKKPLALLLFIAISIYSPAQNTVGIKVYQNTDAFETQFYETGPRTYTKVDNLHFSRISLALDFKTKKGLVHEFEILVPEFSKAPEKVMFPLNYEFRRGLTIEGNVSTLSFRYEINKTLTDKSRPFAFILGGGINPYFIDIRYEPKDAMTYQWLTKLYGFSFNITPRIQYKLNGRFSIDLNVPLKIYDLSKEDNWVKNPSIPISQQKKDETSNTFFENVYTVRLGLMYTLKE